MTLKSPAITTGSARLMRRDDLARVHDALRAVLATEGAIIDEIFCCPA